MWKTFADIKLNVTEKMELVFRKLWKNCGKVKTCSPEAYSPMVTMVSKFFSGSLELRTVW